MPSSKKAKTVQAPVASDFEQIPPTSTALVPPPPFMPDAPETLDFSGDWDSGDLKLPRLELKHGVDTRYQDIVPGRFVYARTNEDYLELTPPFPLTFLRARKGYIQSVEPGEIPMIAWTKAEVVELGGSLERGRPDAAYWAPFADTLIVIDRAARPDWPGTQLLDINGQKVAAATYRIKGTAFNEVGTVLASWEKFQKMGGNLSARIFDIEWELGASLRKGMTFSYFVPTLRQKRAHAPIEQKQLAEMGGNL
jgi:hypothetical protein